MTDVTEDIYAGVVARPETLDFLRSTSKHPVHAYLFLGVPGRGSCDAARAFAGALLCDEGGCGHCRTCRLAIAGDHPDIISFEPEGAFLLRSDAEEIIRVAARSPVESARKVLVLTEFHRAREVAPMLLKTIEEPPASTIFVIVADAVVPELVTIASRCVRVPFDPIPGDLLRALLVERGVSDERAVVAAQGASGDFARAWVLVKDEHLAGRRSFWANLPRRLDDTGATVSVVTEEALMLVEEACEPLRLVHEEELSALEERVEVYGERGSGRRQLEAKQRRELRRHRSQELRFGFAVLASCYSEELSRGKAQSPEVLRSLDAIQQSAEHLVRNPNESLLLQALFLKLAPRPMSGVAASVDV